MYDADVVIQDIPLGMGTVANLLAGRVIGKSPASFQTMHEAYEKLV